jgi:hypothetical protein
MTNATGFLLRTSLSDTGTLPRSGNWTGCPDIIPAGVTSIAAKDMTSDAAYGRVIDNALSQGLTNYMYLRAKNLNTTQLTQKAYMFQVAGSLVLHPEIWYGANNLVGFDVKNDRYDPNSPSSPDNMKIVKKYEQVISALPGQVGVTEAFSWKPQTTEHHCLVGVVADNWQAVLANYNQAGTMDALALWIYGNPSMGWHNVNIVPVTSTVYEGQTAYRHSNADESITFTIVANNVPVGARVSFSSNTSTSSHNNIGVGWTTVSAPPDGGATNPDFEVGTTLIVEKGYTGIITYRTDFNGLAVPSNFAMSMKATTTVQPPAPVNSLVASFVQADSLLASFGRSHSSNAVFRSANEVFGRGLDGYRKMMLAGPPDDGGDLEDSVVVVVGSHTTTPSHSY